MPNYTTITADEAWRKAATDKVPLVNSYDKEQDVVDNEIPGATPYLDFKRQAAKLPTDTEIMFYCACPNDELATQRAQEYAAQGFTNLKVVQGGFKALQAKSQQSRPGQSAAG